MKETQLTVPDIGLIAGTRAALGIGLGFLLADYIPRQERRAAGWTLVALGAITTIPLVWKVFGNPRPVTVAYRSQNDESEREFSEHLNGREVLAAG
jgi:multisubunit Na+/H+ antiporter MnhB subunit